MSGHIGQVLRVPWTEPERAVLREHYETSPQLCRDLLPHRTRGAIWTMAHSLGLQARAQPQCLAANWSTVEGIKSHCKVTPNGCWLWLGGCCGGTPKIRAFDPAVGEKRPMSGPRAMWLAAFGRLPRNIGFAICQPKCLNPLHLREARTQAEAVAYLKRMGRYKGTNLEQRAAAARKGRQAQGMVDTPIEVVRAIKLAPSTISTTELARMVGRHRKTVSQIRRGVWYRHVA